MGFWNCINSLKIVKWNFKRQNGCCAVELPWKEGAGSCFGMPSSISTSVRLGQKYFLDPQWKISYFLERKHFMMQNQLSACLFWQFSNFSQLWLDFWFHSLFASSSIFGKFCLNTCVFTIVGVEFWRRSCEINQKLRIHAHSVVGPLWGNSGTGNAERGNRESCSGSESAVYYSVENGAGWTLEKQFSGGLACLVLMWILW